nr:hypothetical protein [Tanacetum cinerariifolium]
MVAYLSKSDASKGFNQILDFLNRSSIKYALTVNLNIYVSCIKQFWNTVVVKQVSDDIRLQALVDKKKVVVRDAAIRECMSAKRTSWNEFSSSMTSAVICLSTGRKFNFSKYIFDSLKVFANMRRVGKGFFGVETHLFEGMLVDQEADEEGDVDEHAEEVTAGDDAHGDNSAAHGEVLTRVDTSDDTVMDDESNQERMIAEMDKDDVVVLMDDKEEDKNVEKAKVDESAQDQERQAKSQAKIYKIDMDHANKVLSMQEDETEPAEAIDWDEAIDHVKRKAKEDHAIKRYQVLRRKLQTEAQARKNMIVYLKNVAGFKMDYFKEMSYDDICPIFKAKFNSIVAFLLKTKEQIEEEKNRALQKINETLAERAAKRKKLDEEVEDLKRHLEIMPNEDDDVYTEATPLVRKVPVVDYEII